MALFDDLKTQIKESIDHLVNGIKAEVDLEGVRFKCKEITSKALEEAIQIITEAKGNGKRVIDLAGKEAEEIINVAGKEANNIILKAEEEAKRIVVKAEEQTYSMYGEAVKVSSEAKAKLKEANELLSKGLATRVLEKHGRTAWLFAKGLECFIKNT